MARAFHTLRVGEARIEGWRMDVRLVRSEDEWFVISGDISRAFASLDEACIHVESNVPAVVWRETLEPTPDEKPCPICEAPSVASARYPQQLCPACVHEAVDRNGNSVRFYNTSLSGGFEAHSSNGKVSDEHACWVRGVRCYADEGHFGGIVIEISAT